MPRAFKSEPTFEAWQTAHKSILSQLVSAARLLELPSGPNITVSASECHTIRCRFTLSAPTSEALSTIVTTLETLELDGATGWLVGAPHDGMAAMFTMMNAARLGVGLQGLAVAEATYQQARAYARERLQGRAPGGARFPDLAADPIIVHPDVRRMLLTARAYAEGGRALMAYCSLKLDVMLGSDDADERSDAEGTVALLTPIVKAFLTDNGWTATSACQQVFGGHGYIKEWGMEQIARDARIATLYEGTTGVQSLENPYAPIGALYDLDGWVLLLGVGMSSNTSVHYGEHLAGQVLLPRWVLIEGVPKQTWFPNCSGAFSRLHKGLKTDRRSVTLGRATLEAYPVRAVVGLAHLRVTKDPEALLCGFSGCRCQDVRKRVRAQGLYPRIHQVSIQDTPH